MAYKNRYIKTAPPLPAVAPEFATSGWIVANEAEEDEPWKPDEVKDSFYGLDETDYWSEEKKARVKQGRATPKPRPKKVDELNVEIIKWDQPETLEITLLNDIEAAHKQQPHAITYTVVNPSSDPNDPETKRRIFRNLHRQLQQEVEKAFVCGSWMSISVEVVNEAKGLAGKTTTEWEDVDMTLFEPRVRELVKLLIAKRRDAATA